MAQVRFLLDARGTCSSIAAQRGVISQSRGNGVEFDSGVNCLLTRKSPKAVEGQLTERKAGRPPLDWLERVQSKAVKRAELLSRTERKALSW